MSLSVVFTDDATEMLLTTALLIEQRWGRKVADKFLKKAYNIINITARNPYMFKATSFDNEVRSGLIAKQTSFFYKVTETELIILFFWDNRQEPMFNPL